MPLDPFVFEYEGRIVGLRERATTEDVEADVNAYALRPLARDEYAVFSMDLCNNQVDRHFSRFPDEELERICALTPGRPLLERHDMHGTLPRGLFFRAQVCRDNDRVSVRPDVYVMRTQENEDFILNIEGGVYRETSIGFSFKTPECSICSRDLRTCDHVPGRSYGDDVCHYIMRDVLEVLEGSVVASGSQGTRFVSQERQLPLAQALDQARRNYHEPISVWSQEVCALE